MKIDYKAFFIACAKAGLKVTAAIKIAGVTNNTLANIKRGKSINAETAGKLAKALNVDVAELLAND